MPTVEAANSAVGTFSLILFIGSTLYLVWMFQKFFQKKDSQMPEDLSLISQKGVMKRLLLALLKIYERGMQDGDFYEEPIGEDFVYPDQ